DLHRRMEVQGLRAIDRAWARQPRAQYRRDQARGVEPMGDALAEPGLRRIDVAQMDRIVVAGEPREADHVGIHHALHQDFAQADVEILEIEDLEHARIDGGFRARQRHRYGRPVRRRYDGPAFVAAQCSIAGRAARIEAPRGRPATIERARTLHGRQRPASARLTLCSADVRYGPD